MKLELYKAYKTRAGHKAVVNHAMDEKTVMAFHFEKRKYDTVAPVLVYHNVKTGEVWANKHKDKYDIVSEWLEPRKGEFWVNVDEDGFRWVCDSFEECNFNSGIVRRSIARKKITWTEGDKE